MSPRLLPLGLIIGGAIVAACNSDESTGNSKHLPNRATLVVNGSPMNDDTLRIPANASAAVRILFYDGNHNLDDVEIDHFSTLNFNPVTGIAVTADPAHHYRFTVTAAVAAGTIGGLDVGFGHDAAADEKTLHYGYRVE